MAAAGKVRPDVTEAELAVLEVLWAAAGAGAEAAPTIRDITDRLYPGKGSAHYATVQKLLDRLAGKGFVARAAGAAGLAHRFRATVARDELVARRLRTVADRLCGGSLTPLLTHLVRAQPLKPEEIRALRSLIDSLDQDPPPLQVNGRRRRGK